MLREVCQHFELISRKPVRPPRGCHHACSSGGATRAPRLLAAHACKTKPTEVKTCSLQLHSMASANTRGSCSHPGCPWTGQPKSYNKHKEGAGINPHIPGQHPGCSCCSFVPPSSSMPQSSESVLQRTLSFIKQVKGHGALSVICVQKQ